MTHEYAPRVGVASWPGTAAVVLRSGATHAALLAFNIDGHPVRVLVCDQARAYPVSDVIESPLQSRRLGCSACVKWRRAYLLARRQMTLPGVTL